MTKGNYIVYPTPEETDIVFELSPSADQPIPAEQQDLLFDIQSTLEIVRTLYQDDRYSFSTYFTQLLKLAQVGLVGDAAQPQLARRALEQLKVEITNRESGKIKNRYLRVLGRKALLFGLPALILGSLFNYMQCRGIEVACINCTSVANILILWAGTMIGVWLSFTITRTIIGFDDLTIIEKDRLEPSLRLFFTGSLAMIFGLLFHTKAIEISLGSLSSTRVFIDPVTAFLFGVILGLNEKIIGSSLSKKAMEVFSK